MSKRIRDFLFLIFIICFLAGTLLISLYASGYEINFSWPPKFSRLLVKTGMIIISSSPSGAKIFLNGQEPADFSLNPWDKAYLDTPAKIRNVMPAEYDLRLELDGYRPFTETVNVYPGQTATLSDLNLFRNNLPLLVATVPAGDLRLSPSRRYIYAAGGPELIAVATGLAQSLTATDGATAATGTPAVWLNGGDTLLWNGQLVIPGGQTTDYQKLIGSGATDWYYDGSNGRLYYKDKNSLSYLDTGNQNSVLVLSGDDYLAYEARGGQLWAVVKSGGQTVLRQYSVADKKLEQEISLPDVGRYRFQSDGHTWLTLYDEQNNTLYLINPDDITAGRIALNNVLNWAWVDNNTLFYNNNWEIYRLDLNTDTSTLITRVGAAINELAWNAKKNYLIFATAKSLNALDLATGTITNIFQTEAVASPVLDTDSDTLYFWAKVGRQQGVYSLLLQ